MHQPESKKDTVLKRTQLVIAILAGLATLAVGGYNVKKTFFAPTGPGALSLEVRAENGKGVAGASVQITRAKGALVQSSKTAPNGHYELSDLDPGNYALKASRSGFEPESILFEIEPGRTTELEIELKAVFQQNSALRNTVEELGASWLKTLASPKSKLEDKTPIETTPAN